MSWVIDMLDEKITNNITDEVHTIEIQNLDCKNWVASELFETMLSLELHPDGINKLVLRCFYSQCEPFNNEVMTRLSQAFANLKHLEVASMQRLSAEGVN